LKKREKEGDGDRDIHEEKEEETEDETVQRKNRKHMCFETFEILLVLLAAV
jgi:hypothetical protein